MIVSISQPAYLPWLGYFDRLSKSDIHIVMDHVVMDKSSKTKFTNRNKIRTPNGWSWLTVPISSKNNLKNMPINDLKIDNASSWSNTHYKSIKLNYSNAKYFTDYENFFNEVYQKKWDDLISLLKFTNDHLINFLGIKKEIITSSSLNPISSKSDLILELCQKVDAHAYISGPFGRDYLDLKSFENAGISLQFQDYSHPVYTQKFKGFEPNMSIIDLLLNHGKDSLKILKNE